MFMCTHAFYIDFSVHTSPGPRPRGGPTSPRLLKAALQVAGWTLTPRDIEEKVFPENESVSRDKRRLKFMKPISSVS